MHELDAKFPAYVLDKRAGYLPYATIRGVGSASHVARTYALAHAFAARHCLVNDGGMQGVERTFHRAAERAGVPVHATELSGGARVTP